MPIAYLIVRASEGGWKAINETLARDATSTLLTNTLVLTTSVTAATVVIGVALAWFTTRVALPFPRLWPVVVALPLAVPSYVAALTWVSTFPDFDGFWGSFTILTLYCYPYVYLPTAAALHRSDPSLEEASRSLGRSSLSTFLRIVVPQLRNAVAAGALLVALYVLSEFGAIAIMRFDTLTRGIYLSYNSGFDRTPAAILGLTLVAMTLVIVWGESLTRGRKRQRGSAAVTRTTEKLNSKKLRWTGLAFCFSTMLITLALPATMLVRWTIEGASQVDIDEVITPTLNSLLASGLGALVTVVAALPVALLAARHPSRLSSLLERLSYVGHALPGIVISLALVFLSIRYLPDFYQELPVLVLAYVVLFLPLAVGAIHASAAQAPPSMEEVARSLGKRPLRVLTSVTLPLTLPGIAAGAALVFLTTMKELPATLLLQPTGFDTLATRVWTETGVGAYSAAAIPATLLVLVAAVPTYLLSIRSKVSGSTADPKVNEQQVPQ